MIYQLVYTRRAVRDLETLDEVTQQRLKKKLERYKSDP